MSKEIKKHIPSANIIGNASPPRSGAFEVTINNKLIFSKLKTGDFPQTQDIINWF